jgi:hypothetical protein
MASFDPAIGLPGRSALLLLKARALPEEAARDAWAAWVAENDIETASWMEIRLLAGVGGRIDLLDPDSPLRPRLEGIRRFIWTRNQMRLGRSIPFLETLSRAGIPFLLLKGGARIAQSGTASGERFIRDLDVLVTRERVSQAVDAVLDAGFRPMTGRLPGRARAVPFDHVYGDGGAGRDGCEIDLHYSALRYGRWGDFDGPLWDRAVPARLRSLDLLVPSAADQLVIAIVHGMIGDVDAPADWVLDALDAIARDGFDWQAVVAETRARKIGMPMSVGLEFLAREFGVAVPDEVMRGTREGASHVLSAREFAIESRLSRDRSIFDGYILGTAETLRSHRWVRPKDERKTSYSGHRRGAKRLPEGGGAKRLPGEFPLPEGDRSGPLRVSVRLGFSEPPPHARLSFDLLLNGRWQARLKIRPGRLDDALGRRAWEFGLPLDRRVSGASPGVLKIVPLGEGYKPLDEPPVEVRAEVEVLD